MAGIGFMSILAKKAEKSAKYQSNWPLASGHCPVCISSYYNYSELFLLWQRIMPQDGQRRTCAQQQQSRFGINLELLARVDNVAH